MLLYSKLWGGLSPIIQVFLLILLMSNAEKFDFLFHRSVSKSDEMGNMGPSTFRYSE